jgi:hypothetical protein
LNDFESGFWGPPNVGTLKGVRKVWNTRTNSDLEIERTLWWVWDVDKRINDDQRWSTMKDSRFHRLHHPPGQDSPKNLGWKTALHWDAGSTDFTSSWAIWISWISWAIWISWVNSWVEPLAWTGQLQGLECLSAKVSGTIDEVECRIQDHVGYLIPSFLPSTG